MAFTTPFTVRIIEVSVVDGRFPTFLDGAVFNLPARVRSFEFRTVHSSQEKKMGSR